MHDVVEILATHMLSENTAQMEYDGNELARNSANYDLNVEDFRSYFNASVFQDSQMKNDGTIPATQVQNFQENFRHEQNIPSVDKMSANPAPIAS